MQITKTMIRLGGGRGWSESSLGAQSLCQFCRVAAHMDNILFKVMICDIVKLDWFFYYIIIYMTFKKGIFVPNYAFKTGNACIHNILSEKKSLENPDYFSPYSEHVENMESCFVCLDVAFIFEDLCINFFVVVSDAEEQRGRNRNGTFKKLLFRAMLAEWVSWAPSNEFIVSSSIPSWQIVTAHAQPFRGARDLAFCLKVPLDSLLVWVSSGGSGETARMRRLVRTFAARIGDKYQIRLTRPIFTSMCKNHETGKKKQAFDP